MFKSVKRKLLLLSIIILVASLFVWIFPAFGGSADYVKGKINENVPSSILIASIEKNIKDSREEITDYKLKLNKLGQNQEKAEKEYNSILNEKDKINNDLVIIKNLLSQNKETYIINGTNYDKTDIEEDALYKLEQYKNLETKISMYKTLVSKLDVSYKQCRINLQKYKKDIDKAKMQLNILKTKEANIELCKKLHQQYGIDSFGIRDMTNLNSNLNLYKERIEKEEFLLLDSEVDSSEIQYISTVETSIIEEIKDVVK